MLDGSIKGVKEVGTVNLNGNIILRDVLYVLDFKHNLLYVSKLL